MPIHFLVAPDSFKGSLTALEASLKMISGIQNIFPDAVTDFVPMADGGEGTVAALVAATNGQVFTSTVKDPLGHLIEAPWGVLGNGNTVVIEMAAASGLPLVPIDKRNPLLTSTFGTGQLLRLALDYLKGRENRSIILGIGGSATNDGGAGAMTALGARFLDSHKKEIPLGGAALSLLDSIDISSLHEGLATTPILVACDVDNPLCGPKGASAIFGPQKGASKAMVEQLDAALAHYADIAETTVKKNIREVPGAGAAGGLGAGLLLFTSAKLKAGVELIIDATAFEERVKKADIIMTGEGSTDFQTVFGKAPIGVAKAAKKYGKPVICVSGGLGKDAEDVFPHGIDALESSICDCMSQKECLHNAEIRLEKAVERILRSFKLGMEFSK